MKLKDVKVMAKSKGINAEKLEMPELIRAIQQAEGNSACFGTATSGSCDQSRCLWRVDCLPQTRR